MRPNCPQCGRTMTPGSRAQSGKVRWFCRGENRKSGYCYSTTDPSGGARTRRGDSVDEEDATPIRSEIPKKKRYIITSAQNATPVHKPFLRALEVCAARLDAAIVVIPIRYKNPTSVWEKSQSNAEFWYPEVAKYLFAGREYLCKNLVLLADIKTQPTASSPLSGFDAITHSESGILGHTKLQLRTIATPTNRHPKILTTTGACTLPNYTDTKTGKLGEFHHSLAAALVEIDGDRFHLRQLNATKDGSFYDLDTLYTEEGFTTGHAIEGLVMGDTHVDFIDPAVERATFGKGGIVDALRPKHLVWHDLCDGYSVNHHHGDNPFFAIAKHRGNRRDVAQEVYRACQFVRERTREGQTSVVVPSNHNDFVRRWIISSDWRDDPVNAEFYLTTALEMVRATKLGDHGTEYPNAFIMWARRLLEGSQFVVPYPDASYTIAGVEVNMHGDAGPGGARGSIRNLRRIGVKSIIGHGHSPGIDEGCYQTGTSTRLKAEYTAGPMSWLNTHAAIYPNGKRALLNIIDGRWRL